MDPNITRLVSEGRHLRDYMLHEVPGKDAIALYTALQPFGPGRPEPGEDDEVALADAFQAGCEAARTKADGYTLREVLAGRSPHIRRHPLGISSMLLIIAGVTLFLSLYWTHWSTQVTSLIAIYERYDSFDHDTQILELIELRRHYTTVNAGTTNRAEIEPPKAFLSDLAGIEKHYMDEAFVVKRLNQLLKSRRPIRGSWERFRRWVCTEHPLEGALEWPKCPAPPEHLLVQPEEKLDQVERRLAEARDGEAEIDKVGGADGTVEAAARFDDGPPGPGGVSDDEDTDAYHVTMADASAITRLAGRDERLLQSYPQLRYIAQNRAEDLRSKHSLTTQWALPAILGALGSIIYCIWRVLSPSHATLGFIYTAVRTAFAALAALTLTTLILPSQVLATGVDASQPLVYLMAFVFGYSIDVFIATLNRVNTALVSRLSVREVENVNRR